MNTDELPFRPKVKPQCYVGLHGGPTIHVVEDYDTVARSVEEAREDDEYFIKLTGVLQDGAIARTTLYAPMVMWISEAPAE